MSTAIMAEVDAKADELVKEAGSFGILPAGSYEATVKAAEVVAFAKQGKYADKKALNVQLQILAGSPTGSGRVFFARVPLFQRFLPTQKNPQGAIASLYFNFFLALGVSKEDVAQGKLPTLEELGGKRVGFSLAVKEPDDYHDSKFNEVRNVFAPKSVAGVTEPGRSAVGSAFQPKAGVDSPWGTQAAAEPTAPQGDSTLQAAAEGSDKTF